MHLFSQNQKDTYTYKLDTFNLHQFYIEEISHGKDPSFE